MQERLQLDVSDTRARLEADRLHLQQEVSVLAEQMADQRTDSRSAAAGLAVRLQAVEAQNAKVTPAPAASFLWARPTASVDFLFLAAVRPGDASSGPVS